MVYVRCRETEDEPVTCLRLTVEGHAGYAPRGRDIVCAAVSILVYGLGIALRQLEDGCAALRVARWKSSAGYSEVEVQLLPEALAEGKAAFAVALGGFALLADSYPQCVAMQIENETNWNNKDGEYDA